MAFWNQVLLAIQERVSKQCFDTWFHPISCIGIKDGALRLTVPNEIFKKCLTEKFSSLLSEVICEIGNFSMNSLKLEISVNPSSDSASINHGESEASFLSSDIAFNSNQVGDQAAPAVSESSDSSVSSLNQRYTFDNFIVGSSNEFAYAAALAVAENPAKSYNPLYLYGGAGLGKTHLMHAIGNFIKSRHNRARLCYLSSEQFMNAFVLALRDKDRGQMLKFRRNYRNIDVLLMDDIQDLTGKEATQLEFFHTFNALYNAGKQIVLASDLAPKQISTLDERLHSRFGGGLTADTQRPDFETKLAIILKKKSQSGLEELSDSVSQFIAAGINSNIRELEGALNRLSARASLNGINSRDIDIAYAKEVLRGFIRDASAQISSDSIVNAVSSFFGLKPAQLRAKCNAKPIAVPRQIAMYICKELTSQSLPQIGKDFGGKHHTTVLHSIRKIESLKNNDSNISEAVKKIVNSLK
jgi:chromosomal replication initiator protein